MLFRSVRYLRRLACLDGRAGPADPAGPGQQPDLKVQSFFSIFRACESKFDYGVKEKKVAIFRDDSNDTKQPMFSLKKFRTFFRPR